MSSNTAYTSPDMAQAITELREFGQLYSGYQVALQSGTEGQATAKQLLELLLPETSRMLSILSDEDAATEHIMAVLEPEPDKAA